MGRKSKVFDYSFMAFGLLIQIVTYLITNRTAGLMGTTGWLSLASGCLGVCSVCLTSQGKILTYAFGFAQVFTYTYLCWIQRFYGEIGINIFYFVTMIYGIHVWRNRLVDNGEGTVLVPRSLSLRMLVAIIGATFVGAWLTGWGLAIWTDDTQPYLDAYTTIPALVAQVLMILAYREHWFIWLAVDIMSIVLWLRAGDYCLAAQYAFWCANCLYGIHRWRSFGISKV